MTTGDGQNNDYHYLLNNITNITNTTYNSTSSKGNGTAFTHKPQQQSVNSIQSLIEPVTPPITTSSASSNNTSGNTTNNYNQIKTSSTNNNYMSNLGLFNNSNSVHQRTSSLDLANYGNVATITNNNSDSTNAGANTTNMLSSPTPISTVNGFNPSTTTGNTPLLGAATSNRSRLRSLPLINEFDLPLLDPVNTSTMLKNGSNNSNTLNFTTNNNNNNYTPSIASSSNSSANSSSSASLNNKNNKSTLSSVLTNNNSNHQRNISTNSITSTNSVSTSSTLFNDLNQLPLEELDYVKLASDQYGCRFLQKKLETPMISDKVRDLMYQTIRPFSLELILDPFGNYLIQKLCEYLTLEQKATLIQDIYPEVYQISINQYGTRSLQKIIDCITTEQQIDMIVLGFGPTHTSIEQIVKLINDLNGNHVIQKCIFKFPPSKFDFIISAIVYNDNIIKISTHKHGCCVLQKLLSVCTLQQIFKISLKIVEYCPNLINDQFGNYIIQFLFDIKELDFYLMGEIFTKLSNELVQLSCLKFSSNVVEKYIKKLFGVVTSWLSNISATNTDADVVGVATKILLNVVEIFTANLNILIRDNFGNYALQTLLDVKNYSKILDLKNNSNAISTTDMNNSMLQFSYDFASRINKLVFMTKNLLPTIKTTSYAKKIKLKVKSYSELTGISLEANNSNVLNNNANSNAFNGAATPKFNHTRHFSLPANAFNSASVFNGNNNSMSHPTTNHMRTNSTNSNLGVSRDNFSPPGTISNNIAASVSNTSSVSPSPPLYEFYSNTSTSNCYNNNMQNIGFQQQSGPQFHSGSMSSNNPNNPPMGFSNMITNTSITNNNPINSNVNNATAPQLQSQFIPNMYGYMAPQRPLPLPPSQVQPTTGMPGFLPNTNNNINMWQSFPQGYTNANTGVNITENNHNTFSNTFTNHQ
ncbi:Mpt5p SCDLUD_001419 [Saccharomycodes ludwigii]|uniref:Mpt5p n=1 Tax=Saccharomycodes ludwigii TaxID=36035 RepID=UPI001E8C083D|nr:hypothetical protein SCDLUD_001419 [Saccharomycodes ludwigii]KAH3901650.1 hypothetical protein SCDLUD_001419 [Saccharomycodes ludwigii]